jgi:pyrroloquinoline-quinone synthase
MDNAEFREALLSVMDHKSHWAWPAFSTGVVAKDKLHIHLEQEYATYVRDFPVMVGRAYVQCPIPEVRRELAENLYEEETGGLVAKRPHPELFLDYPRGLGMDVSRFDNVTLLPAAAAYRGLLDRLTGTRGWEIATAVVTIFVEGSAEERADLAGTATHRTRAPSEHPLVKYYGLPLTHLRLSNAHSEVEGEHRAAAWRMVVDHVLDDKRAAVVQAMQDALAAWLAYRDGVAAAVGLNKA